eukprot:g30.t1
MSDDGMTGRACAGAPQTIADILTDGTQFLVSTYINMKEVDDNLKATIDSQLNPLVGMLTGKAAEVVGLDKISPKGSGVALKVHVPDAGEFDEGEDNIYVLVTASATAGKALLGIPGLQSASVLVGFGKWEEAKGEDQELSEVDPEPVAAFAVSLKAPLEAMKSLFFGLDISVIIPSLKYLELGFIVSTGDYSLPDGALPEDPNLGDLPGMFAERDAFSMRPTIIGTYPIPDDYTCEAHDIICTISKGIASTVGSDLTVEVGVDSNGASVGLSAGEVWFSDTLGLEQTLLALEFGPPNEIEITAQANLMVCMADCDQPPGSKEYVVFIGILSFALPDVIVGVDMLMKGYYTLPGKMDFMSIGDLSLGAELSFSTFPPSPKRFQFGGAICLSPKTNGGCHGDGSNGVIHNGGTIPAAYEHNTITGKFYAGFEPDDPDGMYIFFRLTNLKVASILNIVGVDTASLPSMITDIGLDHVIRPSDIFVKIAKAIYDLMKLFWDHIQDWLPKIKAAVKQAVEFVQNMIDPVKDHLRHAANFLGSTYNKMKKPFDAAARAVEKIGYGCTVDIVLLDLPKEDHVHFLLLIDEYRVRERKRTVTGRKGGRLFFTKEQASSFIEAEQQAEFGAISEAAEDGLEWGKERAREVAEAAKRAAAKAACFVAEKALQIAFVALKPVWLLYRGISKMHDLLEKANFVDWVMGILNVVEKAASQAFGPLGKALYSGAITEFQGVLNKIFTLQEVSAEVAFSADGTGDNKLALTLMGSIFGNVIDLKASINFGTLDAGKFMANIVESTVTSIINAVVPVYHTLKDAATKVYEYTFKQFQAIVVEAKKPLEQVKGWLAKVDALMP